MLCPRRQSALSLRPSRSFAAWASTFSCFLASPFTWPFVRRRAGKTESRKKYISKARKRLPCSQCGPPRPPHSHAKYKKNKASGERTKKLTRRAPSCCHRKSRPFQDKELRKCVTDQLDSSQFFSHEDGVFFQPSIFSANGCPPMFLFFFRNGKNSIGTRKKKKGSF